MSIQRARSMFIDDARGSKFYYSLVNDFPFTSRRAWYTRLKRIPVSHLIWRSLHEPNDMANIRALTYPRDRSSWTVDIRRMCLFDYLVTFEGSNTTDQSWQTRMAFGTYSPNYPLFLCCLCSCVSAGRNALRLERAPKLTQPCIVVSWRRKSRRSRCPS